MQAEDEDTKATDTAVSFILFPWTDTQIATVAGSGRQSAWRLRRGSSNGTVMDRHKSSNAVSVPEHLLLHRAERRVDHHDRCVHC